MESLALFDERPRGDVLRMGACACVLRGFAWPQVGELLREIAAVELASAFRHMVTPGGFTMSAAMTNCGALGWTTDRRGYRYTSVDPRTGSAWPAMPASFARLARDAAQAWAASGST
jgi:DNA oxidative demethylase